MDLNSSSNGKKFKSLASKIASFLESYDLDKDLKIFLTILEFVS